jgi:hypothetical protein
LIAAASIGTCSSWQCATGTEAACQQFTAQTIREHTAAVLTLPSRGPGLFPRDFSLITCGTGSSCGAGGQLAAASGPEASGR